MVNSAVLYGAAASTLTGLLAISCGSPPAASSAVASSALSPGAGTGAAVEPVTSEPRKASAPAPAPEPLPGGQALAISDSKQSETERTPASPAQRQGLMRRLDTVEAHGKSSVPRSCDSAADVSSDASAADTSGEARAQERGANEQSCYPPSDYVERLCSSTYPSVALIMFSKDSPWRRGYLRGETKAWTTVPSAQQNDRLERDEEVLILQADASSGSGVQYDAGASFYALRWDGSCVKLTQEEMSEHVPWAKKTPLLQWSILDDAQQTALREDDKINVTYLEQRRQCRAGKGAKASQRCQQLAKTLSDLVVKYVRDGGALPDPEFRP